MEQSNGAGVAFIHDDIARIDAGLPFETLNARLDGRELLVEPLSARQTIREFLAEGGLGYGAMSEGSFAAAVCRVKTDQFEYGSDHQTLYNVGYPLQRMVEGAPLGMLKDGPALGEARELVVYVRPRVGRIAFFQPCEAQDARIPARGADAVYVNGPAAALVGLQGAGLITAYRADSGPAPATPDAGQKIEGFWENRFIEDRVAGSGGDNGKQCGIMAGKYLIQPSQLPAWLEQAASIQAPAFGLFVHSGVLLIIGGETPARERIEQTLLSAPYAWKIK